MRTRCRHAIWCFIPLCLAPGNSARGLDPVRVNGPHFQICSQDFRFVGFNLRGICHYGHGDALPYSDPGDIGINLDYCTAAGAKVIRLFCAYRFIGAVETGDRLQTVLDACEQRGIYAIVALTDMYYDSNFYPLGDASYYSNGLLNHSFFAGGYHVNYLPQALYLASRFRNHPAVFAWQLGNEIRDIGNAATYLSFALDAAAQLRAADPNHLLSTGLISIANTGVDATQAQQLYAAFDFLNAHYYDGAESGDYSLAAAMNKPFIVDEAGFDVTVYGYHRTGVSDADITKWIGRGASGYMQWGLMATAYDNGDGDQIYGVDQQNHAADFLEYRDLFSQWATTLEPPPAPPTLLVSPSSLTPTLVAGRSGSQTCSVQNTGTGAFAFTVTAPSWPAWLSVTPMSGTAACSPVTLQLTCQTGGMSPGTYAAQFQVVANGIFGSPQTVSVTLAVTHRPGDFDGDGDVDQTDFAHFQLCLSGPGTPQPDPRCADANLDGDSDVDQNDFSLLRSCKSGPDVPSSPDCAP